MHRYFTADFHLGSTRVLKAYSRPFIDSMAMTNAIIGQFNEIAKEPDDLIYHVGDLYCLKSDNGEPGLSVPWKTLKCRFTGCILNIEGNHDANNGVKSVCQSMRLTLGKTFRCALCHYPSYDERSKPYLVPGDINLCGHVHDKWRYFIDRERKVLNINVGVDQWDFRPVSEVTLVNYLKKLLTESII